MHEYSGSLADKPWTGWLVEREEDLAPFLEWVRRQKGRVCFDTETWEAGQLYLVGPEFLRLAQFGTETEAWVIPAEHGEPFREAIRYALRTLPELVGHDVIRYDGQVVDRHLGVKLEEFAPKVTDTLLTSKLLDPRKAHQGGIGAGLKPQSAKFVDPSAPDTQEGLAAVFKGLKVGHTRDNPVGWRHVPWNHPTYVTYAMLDVILGSRLLVAHEREMKRVGVRQALVPYEHRISKLCAIMSRTGLIVDADYTRSLYGKLEAEREQYIAQAARYGVENINRNREVIEALLGMGETLTKRTDSGKDFAVDRGVLLPLADLTPKWERIGARTPNPVAEAVLHAQRAGKWRSAYVDRFLAMMDSEGRIHPDINTLEARSGRMSITGLAVQTLPSSDWMIRHCLRMEQDAVAGSIDFKAVELRVLAGLANVGRMKQAIYAGKDLHDFTTELVYGANFEPWQRKICKGVGLSKVFGGGADTTAAQTGAPVKAVRYAMQTYDRVYPEVKQASRRWQREARWDGYVTRSATGRILPLDRDRAYAVVNYKVQSTARDVLGQAMINCEEAGLLPYMRLPIHDEILTSLPAQGAQDLAREFERCMTMEIMGVPIEADPDVAGRSWGSLYMKDKSGKHYDAETLIAHDPYFAAHPEEAHALAKK